MRKVKFVCNVSVSNRITPGEIYDVLEYYPMLNNIDDCVYVINDLGFKGGFWKHIVNNDGIKTTLGESVFIDVTSEFRNDIIDNILE